MSELRSVLERSRLQAGRARDACVLAWRERSAAARLLPDFLILGAQKAGTSSLYAHLAAHPQVLAGLRKEVHWFDTADSERRGVDGYRAYFPTAHARDEAARRTGRPVLTGEATPYYLFHPTAPARARTVVPAARLIAVLRDPVGRAVSGYHHAVRFGHERRPIEIALDPAREEHLAPVSDAAWYDGARSPARLRGYLARGRYAEQLERWWASFPPDQLLVVDSRALRRGDALGAVLEFLDLDPIAADASGPERNVGRYPPPPVAVTSRLADYFAPHNELLFTNLGRRFDWT